MDFPIKFFEWFVQNNNPLLLIIAGWLVYEADTHKFSNRYVNTLLRSTLAIYIITEADNIRPIFTMALLPEVMNGLAGFGYILLVCVGCLLIDQVRVALFNIGYLLFKLIKVNK